MFPNNLPRTPRESRLSSRRSVVARTSRSRPARRARRFARRQSRRGVLLLVVLSVLVLFLMIGTAFVIVAKQSEKAAKSAHKGASRLSSEAAQSKLLDEVLYQVLRDTNNPSSSLRGHSLLGDMYGADVLKTRVAGAGWASPTVGGADVTGGQMLELQLDTDFVKDLAGVDIDGYGNLFVVPPPPQTPPPRFSPYDNAYNGQVLTFLSGPAKGRSTRIVGFVPPNRLRVMNFTLENGKLVDNLDLTNNIFNSARLLINGRPFTGTGFGFNRAATDHDAPKLSLLERLNADAQTPPLLGEVALLPNAAFLDANRLWQIRGTQNSDAPTPFDSAGSLLSGAQLAALSDPSNPNHVAQRVELARRIGPAGTGGAHESYDAVDYQNMALALIPGANQLVETVVTVAQLADASPMAPALPTALSTQPSTQPTTGDPVPMIIPSWHRPELINYWANRSEFAGAADIRSSNLARAAIALRRILLRPNWLDHPNFTGSNPEFAAIANTNDPVEWGQKLARMVYGPWDVDNDNDGVRDSIWVDVGLPVMAGPNGKLVKPLAAILIVDMDGRLQANAHGTLDLANAWDGTGLSSLSTPGVALNRNNTLSDSTPRGVGYGPAEISLDAIMNANAFQRLLVGRQTSPGVVEIPGRYGYPHGGNLRPGTTGVFDPLSQVTMNGWPTRSTIAAGNPLNTMFSTPADLTARYGLALNRLGQPLFEATLGAETGAEVVQHSPYVLNLSQSTAAGVHGYANLATTADAPFAPGELERLLRMYDVDAGTLPARLTTLLGNAANDRVRRTLATESFDLPAPNVTLPHEMAGMISVNPLHRRLPRSAAELFEIRVRTALGVEPFPEPISNANAAQTVRDVMRRIVAPELANGERLNLNRPLGSGRDSNGNGVVDEPGETGAMWNLTGTGTTAASKFNEAQFPPMATEVVHDAGNPNGQLAPVDHRHLLARHLYVLALTLTAPENYCTQGAGNPFTEADKELARRLAQWAVNVVDFRDADNIMTMFEYDINPFDGWDVDGFVGVNPGPDQILGTGDDVAIAGTGDDQAAHRGLVWGAERPELLMTETLAWHDRRTDDTNYAYSFPNGARDTNMDPVDPNADKDFDQFYRPRGALFVELYNPWPASPGVNEDTHAAGSSAGQRVDFGVDLARTHLDRPGMGVNGVGYGSPVWRLAIYKRPRVPDLDATKVGEAIKMAANWDPDSLLDPLRRPQANPFPLHRPNQRLDRSVYFTGENAFTAGNAQFVPTDSIAFFNSPNYHVPPVRPGRLMIVGPGDVDSTGNEVHMSPLGDRKRTTPGDPRGIVLRGNNGPTLLTNSGRTFKTSATPLSVQMLDADGSIINAAAADGGYPLQSVQDPDMGRTPDQRAFPGDQSASAVDVAIISQAIDPRDPGATPRQQRLSVSEPARGYPDRFLGSRWDRDDQFYKDAQGNRLAIDVPLDGPIGGEIMLEQQFGPLNVPRVGQNEMPNWPNYLAEFNPATRNWESTVDPVLTQIRPAGNRDMGASHSFVYLQRLANPLLPWNPEPAPGADPTANGYRPNRAVNPYMTIDVMPVNLTVFNSRAGEPNGNEEDGSSSNTPGQKFASFERGSAALKANGANGPMASLHAAEVPVDFRNTPNNNLNTTTLNSPSSFKFNRVPSHTLGILNRAFQQAAAGNDVEKKTEPRNPFDWLTWNNRPYVSANELLLVPRFRSSEINRRFSTAAQAPAGTWPYSTAPKADIDQRPDQFDPFNHLENFFVGETGDPPATPPGVPIHLYRILEYVHTPSLYAGTRTWLNPSSTSQQLFGADASQFVNALDPRIRYQTPFNSISEFRDPGKVNINTIAGENVYRGLFHGNPNPAGGGKTHAGPEWNAFVASRQGTTGATNLLALNSDLPTFFANPFRATDAGDLAPIDALRRTGVDCTLQRSINPPPPTAGNHASPGPKPLFACETLGDHNNGEQNPYFMFQPMIRLDNLVTTRSNVFAMWVTIGFFEVEEADWATATQPNFNNDINLFKRVYPDGYAFGREDGVDVGNIRRLRGFYMIDRTKMAGFEPGADHNVENTVRLRRRIE